MAQSPARSSLGARPAHALAPGDEEALALSFSTHDRRERGRYFTPAALVEELLLRVAPFVPSVGPVAVMDPSCGAGAFLVQAERHFPRASLHGLELDPDIALRCRARIPKATIQVGDALLGGLERLTDGLSPGTFEVWVGNPPYNGTSGLLRKKGEYARLLEPFADELELPRGASLRDDFVFFLLSCAERLRHRRGVLAFVTPSSLLDAFLYSGVRRWLLERLLPCGVLELGGGVFRDTRVRTTVTVWRSEPGLRPAQRSVPYASRTVEGPFELGQLGPEVPLVPDPDDCRLRPRDLVAVALDAAWRRAGEELTTLIPVSFPGLKTRFDELLTDAEPERLLEKVDAFLQSPPDGLGRFAQAYALPPRVDAKLRALHASLPKGLRAERGKLRRFLRYAGARHARGLPPQARAWCYLDRRLIPRGDHRLHGPYEPHACHGKLVFNVRELPLCALFLDEEGCVHDYRHARFAPTHVPRAVMTLGLAAARRVQPLGPLVPNLSPRALALSARAGGPARLFLRIAQFVCSSPVQERWALAFGTSRVLPIPDAVLKGEPLPEPPVWPASREGTVGPPR